MTKIISTVIEKGGTGKTTITYNGAFKLARDGHKVLLIDLDKAPSLTKRFTGTIRIEYLIPDSSEINEIHTVKEFFKPGGGTPVPIKINDNINLIAGSRGLESLKKDVEADMQRMYLLSWYYKNLDQIQQDYDYILIDNHNDLSIFVDNAIAISDTVLSVIDVDLDSMERLSDVENHIEYLRKVMVEPISKKSYVNAKSVKVGNMLEYNTADSHLFKKVFEDISKTDKSYLGCFYRRSALKATKSKNKPLVEVERESTTMNNSTKDFYSETWKLYDKIFKY